MYYFIFYITVLMPPNLLSTMIPSQDHDSIHSRRRRNYLPIVDHCCGCVTELKAAAAIIAVLGVVTSPAVSWAFIRHSYVIRVSCFVSTSAVRTDVVDIHLKNVLSFGFGANAGLGPTSCLGKFRQKSTTTTTTPNNKIKTDKEGQETKDKDKKIIDTRRSQKDEDNNNNDQDEKLSNDSLVQTIRWIGWILLAADIIFIVLSLHFLYSIFRPPALSAAKRFMISCVIALILSFIHGMMYVGVCISVGGSFPIFEFVFCIIDVIAWTYFLTVVNSYKRQLNYEE